MMHVATSDLTSTVACLAWSVIKPEADQFPATEICQAMSTLMRKTSIDAWLEQVQPLTLSSHSGLDDLDGVIGIQKRRSQGIFFTPPSIARWMAELLGESSGAVLDLSAGSGALLGAALESNSKRYVIGVELDLDLAVAAALRILQLRRALGPGEGPDQILVGDGLAEWHLSGPVTSVIGNPPYVGEKNNRELFQTLRRDQQHLAPYFAPRMDLAYLFIHRGLDCLAPGGRLVYLTSEYWLTATGARSLRNRLLRDASPGVFVRLGSKQFQAAPGHHSLLFTLDKVSVGKAGALCLDARDCPPDQESITDRLSLTGRPVASANIGVEVWSPFAPPKPSVDGETVLRDVCRDQQGFVSGADRVTKRMSALIPEAELGAPIFLCRRDELMDGDRAREAIKPVLRSHDCIANRVWLEAPASTFVLYCGNEISDADRPWIEQRLAPFRPVLERRREVQNGRMPWFRLHWPRRQADHEGPKIVVPRRCKELSFCLDLSGSFVSSDCTYLIAPSSVRDPVGHLVGLMLALNTEATFDFLRHFGKMKGDIIECYSEPLRRIPLPVPLEDGEVVLHSALRRVRDQIQNGIDSGAKWIDVVPG